MGSEDSTRNQALYQKSQIKYKLNILLLIILTNLLTIFIVTGSYSNLQQPFSRFSKQFSLPLWDNTTTLLIKLNATQNELVATRFELENLSNKLISANSQIETLLTEISHLHNIGARETSKEAELQYADLVANLSSEAKLALGPHKLPLGFTPQMGSDEVYPSVGGACLRHKNELSNYMSYDIGGECPVDDVSAQKLMLKGCEPLPRRRCIPKSPIGYVEPTPFPESMWSIPPDTSLTWDPYTCKSYKCLVDRIKDQESYDCKDCFDLQGREKTRWLVDNGVDYGIDQILGVKPRGTIRIGLDIGGGTGTFAVRMKERNVTIITTSMNFDGPFNSFMASRGLIPMHVTISQRFPFFDNTLDIIHSMHVLSNWIPESMLEFILYDIYRILRPGGLFWLDRFFCVGPQLNATYVPIFDRVGFQKVRWNAGRKLDRGVEKNEWYFSALLEKPTS